MHIRRQKELLQLIDDISLDINKLMLCGELEHYDLSLISQIVEKLESLRPMQIGTAGVLDSIQYLLGEIQIGHDENEFTYIEVGNIQSHIQDYLDWLHFLRPNRQERVRQKAINADKILWSVKRTGRPGAIGSAQHL